MRRESKEEEDRREERAAPNPGHPRGGLSPACSGTVALTTVAPHASVPFPPRHCSVVGIWELTNLVTLDPGLWLPFLGVSAQVAPGPGGPPGTGMRLPPELESSTTHVGSGPGSPCLCRCLWLGSEELGQSIIMQGTCPLSQPVNLLTWPAPAHGGPGPPCPSCSHSAREVSPGHLPRGLLCGCG